MTTQTSLATKMAAASNAASNAASKSPLEKSSFEPARSRARASVAGTLQSLAVMAAIIAFGLAWAAVESRAGATAALLGQ